MPQSQESSRHSVVGRLVVIGVIVGFAAGAFAYTAGWFSPRRLTPEKIIAAFGAPTVLGHRRNHAKGTCVTGVFEANGAGSALSKAAVFTQGRYPVVGRFNLGTPDPNAPDATVRVRGLGISLTTPDGQVWRSAMINAPVFAVSTPQAFHALQLASGSKDPKAMPAFIASHGEFREFAAWAGTGQWTGSYVDERYNALNAFIFIDGAGTERAVRWSLLPGVQPVAVPAEELAKRGPDFLEEDLLERVAHGPLHWTMVVTVAAPGDPTADPTKAWPPDRQTIEVGTLVFEQVQAERNGPCRDINFDPTLLPDGIRTSDDPFPSARSSAYAKSYDLRTAEYRHYPYSGAKEKP